jgi:hypothetical protein
MISKEELLRMPEPDPEAWWNDVENAMTGLRRTYLLLAAMDLKVFDAMQNAKGPEELAVEVGMDPRFAEGFCRSLCEAGLLRQEGGKYMNSPSASMYLNSSSPYYQLHSFGLVRESLPRWQDLPSVLRAGPDADRGKRMGEEWIRSIAERSMLGSVQRVTKAVSEVVDMSGGKRLLDLGGGHGLYAIAFSARHPDLRADVFDRPSITPVTREYISRYGASNVRAIEGDFERDESIGNGYDVLFSSFNQSGSDARVVPKMSRALKGDGTLVVRRHSGGWRGPLMDLEWSLAGRGGPGGHGKSSDPSRLSLEDYRAMLERNGFKMLNEWSPDKFSIVLVAKKLGD